MGFYNEFKLMFITICFLGYIFLVSGLIVNILQLLSCIIWPFNRALYRKINCYLALGIWSRKLRILTLKRYQKKTRSIVFLIKSLLFMHNGGRIVIVFCILNLMI